MLMDYPLYESFAITDKEKKLLTLLSEGTSKEKAAKELNINHRTVYKILSRIKKRSSIQGFSPDSGKVHKVPEEYYVKGSSTLYDKDGQKKLEWVKTNIKAQSLIDVTKGIVEALKEDVVGLFEPVRCPEKPNYPEFLTVLPIGDAHAGLFSWERETGENYCLKTWESDIIKAYDYLLHGALPTKECLIVNLGDYLHGDDTRNVTPRSGNTLDIDTRFHKILQVAVKSLVYVVKKALEKHEKVTLINVTGNHDTMSSYALSLVLDAYFVNEPRVEVRTEPKTFHYYEFGKVMIMSTHGDTCNMDKCPSVMATDQSEMWGRTKHRYALTGHIHHTSRKEFSGAIVESFRSLVAKDAWHYSAGYRAGRDMTLMTLHRDFGEVSRLIANIDLLRAFDH
jgi:hypothetical protein